MQIQVFVAIITLLSFHSLLVRLVAFRTIRYRLHPHTRRKAQLLLRCLGATRFVWNHCLADHHQRMATHRTDPDSPRPNTSFFALGKAFIRLRQSTEWLQELPCAPIRYVLKYQADAWQACFKNPAHREGKGFPQFKSRAQDDDSVTFPKGCFQLTGHSLHLQRIGQVTLKGREPYPQADVKQVVIRSCAGKFYATVCFDVPVHVLPPKNDNGRMVGIDRNAGQIATSDGELLYLPDLKRLETRRRRYQRRMARRRGPCLKQGTKPSKRYLKAKQCAAKASRKMQRVRDDWQHQTSRRLANQFQYGAVERLNTRTMTQSARGSRELPGQGVKQKSGLNRVILNTGWSALQRKLAYKMDVVEVSAYHTSQCCAKCGHVAKENRRTQAVFSCVKCGHRENADVNAAINILALGTRAIGQGGRSPLGDPMNCQANIPDHPSSIL